MKYQRTFVISLVMVALLVLTACKQALPAESPETGPREPETTSVIIEEEILAGSEYFAANPELMAANRTITPALIPEEASGSLFYAQNPELMVAGRYNDENTMTESDILARNPELKVVQQYNTAKKK